MSAATPNATAARVKKITTIKTVAARTLLEIIDYPLVQNFIPSLGDDGKISFRKVTVAANYFKSEDILKVVNADNNKLKMFYFLAKEDGDILWGDEVLNSPCQEKVDKYYRMGTKLLDPKEIEYLILENSYIDRDFRERGFKDLSYWEPCKGRFEGSWAINHMTNNLEDNKSDIIQTLYHRIGIPRTKETLDRWLSRLTKKINTNNKHKYILIK